MGVLPSWTIDALGVAAALCSMTSFIPQIVKLLKERDAAGVSLRMYAVTVTGFVLWSAYGVLSGSWPVAGSNIVNLVLAAAILILKLRIDAGERVERHRGLANSLSKAARASSLRLSCASANAAVAVRYPILSPQS